MAHSILECFLEVMPVMRGLISSIAREDVSMGITDNQQFIGSYASAVLDTGIKAGDLIKIDDPIIAVLRSGENFTGIVPEEVFGVPFKAGIHPIFDEHKKTIGTISYGLPLTTQYKIESTSAALLSLVKQTGAGIEEIAASLQELSATMNSIVAFTRNTNGKVRDIDAIINLITRVSSQSRLLGLNAAIEAARAGEVGNSFAVVAKEMTKLSESSRQSAKKIEEYLLEIKESINENYSHIENVSEIVTSQATAIQQITDALQDSVATSQDLVDLCTVK